MDYKQGISRHQLILYPEYLDEIIDENNPVRIIDAYVDHLELEKIGLMKPELKTGAPPYPASMFIKLYIYGHLYKIRTSRTLEMECRRNIELKWLLKNLQPCFKTISDFRKKNRRAMNALFSIFQEFCYDMGLIKLKKVAIDGTKIYGQNSTNNVYRRDEIEKIQERITRSMEEYLNQLDENDEDDGQKETVLDGKVSEVLKKIEQLERYKKKLK